MIDVLRATPARGDRGTGRNVGIGPRGGKVASAVGRYAAEHGVDLLIAVHGQARAMQEAAIAAGIAGAKFFEDPAVAGEFLRREAQPGDAVLFKGSRGVQVERALSEFLLITYNFSHALFPTLRKVAPVLQPIPGFPLYDFSHGLCQPDGAVPLRRPGALAD